jgi:hypothetical protein
VLPELMQTGPKKKKKNYNIKCGSRWKITSIV